MCWSFEQLACIVWQGSQLQDKVAVMVEEMLAKQQQRPLPPVPTASRGGSNREDNSRARHLEEVIVPQIYEALARMDASLKAVTNSTRFFPCLPREESFCTQ